MRDMGRPQLAKRLLDTVEKQPLVVTGVGSGQKPLSL